MIQGIFPTQATYWGAPQSNGFGGFTYSAPQIIKVRWEDRSEQFTDEIGDVQVSRAVVFIQEDLDLDGYLYLGVSAETNPSAQEGAFRIRKITKIPDLRGVQMERLAFL